MAKRKTKKKSEQDTVEPTVADVVPEVREPVSTIITVTADTPATPSKLKPKKKGVHSPKVDWRKTPFAVVTGGKIIATAKDLDKAIDCVQGLPVARQGNAFVGQFYPVKVKTSVELDKG